MNDATRIDIAHDVYGNVIDANTGQITNNYITYQQARPRPTDPAVLADATNLLARLPLDTIPDPAPLPAGSRMPLAPNPLFTGREPDLMALARVFKGDGATTIGRTAAVTGMGGLGKTQLAAEFAHRYGQFFAGGVFWLSFAEPATIASEIAACGGQDGLDFSPDFTRRPLVEQVAAVGAAWKSALPRLLVFDNCEDEALLSRWRPTTGGCCILITTRHARWDKTLGVREMPLAVLRPEASVALLRKHRPDLAADSPELHSIANELGNLPLALHLAGNFLSDYRSVTTPTRYLAELRSPDLLQHPSLKRTGYAPTSPATNEQDVARAFALSYDRLNPDDPVDRLARDLLARAAYLVPGELIPHDLLRALLEPADSSTAYQHANAVKRLIDTGLVEEVPDGMFRLHRLVVAFVRTVTDDTSMQQAVEDAVLTLATRLKDAGYPTPIRLLLPHLREITDNALGRGDSRAANLCNILAESLALTGDYANTHSYATRALAIREQVLGPDHPDTASSLHNLAGLLQMLGDYAGARPLYERALAIREQVLGPDHPATAHSLSNLAELLGALGDYASAQPLHERALAIRERALGPDHPDTAHTLNNLATLLQNLGNYVAARSLYERALAIRERVLGPDHPATAHSLINLAELLRAIGDYAAARPLLERALVISEQTLGPHHPDTAFSLNNLAGLLQNMGEYAAARPLLERALAIHERVLGPDHPDTALSLNNLALLLYNLRDYAHAKPLFERAIDVYDRLLGRFHPDGFYILNNLAQIHFLHGNRLQARMYFTRALDTLDRNPSLKHVAGQEIRRQLAQLGGPFRNMAKPKQKRKK